MIEINSDEEPEWEEDVGATTAAFKMSDKDVQLIFSSSSKDRGISGLLISAAAATPVSGAAHGDSLTAEATQSAARRRYPADQTVRSKAKIEASTALTLPTSTMMSYAEEARRERNRLKVRRLYYKKLDRMNALRAQVADLGDRLELLKIAQSSSVGETGLIVAGSQPATAKPARDYVGLLQELSSTRQRLQHDNEFLRRSVSQYVKSVHAISVKMMQQREPSIAYLKIKSVTLRECAELRGRTLSQMHKFAQKKSMFTDAGSICGWHSRHFIQNTTFQFNIEKRRPNHSAAQIAQVVWSVVSDPDQFARLFSTAVDMKCYLLQTIDVDNFVVFQEFRAMIQERSVVACSVQLISRARTPSGVLITVTSLDRDNWVLDEPSVSQQDSIWTDHSSWSQYTDVPNSSDCAYTLSGSAPVVDSKVGFWMLEMVQLVVRCERMAMGSGSYSLLSTTATDEKGGSE